MKTKLEKLNEKLKELKLQKKIPENLLVREKLSKLSGKWGFQSFEVDFRTSRTLSYYGEIREWNFPKQKGTKISTEDWNKAIDKALLNVKKYRELFETRNESDFDPNFNEKTIKLE